MKKIIGILAVFIAVAFIGVLALRIWDVEIVSLRTLVRSSATLIILGVLAVVLVVIYGAFFRNNERSYDRSKGNRAHPKM
ncbi:hypothetical protein [Pedobacter sp. SYP-B3415]|uniref:hypothetical protein n=1 Tax=Pedobacter sp. SYP-B3415 TaxID=2496641 RepID=UPI00101BEBB4|nr:hypothetical protein [Pedobacter sp. SYP-B3415]